MLACRTVLGVSFRVLIEPALGDDATVGEAIDADGRLAFGVSDGAAGPAWKMSCLLVFISTERTHERELEAAACSSSTATRSVRATTCAAREATCAARSSIDRQVGKEGAFILHHRLVTITPSHPLRARIPRQCGPQPRGRQPRVGCCHRWARISRRQSRVCRRPRAGQGSVGQSRRPA